MQKESYMQALNDENKLKQKSDSTQRGAINVGSMLILMNLRL